MDFKMLSGNSLLMRVFVVALAICAQVAKGDFQFQNKTERNGSSPPAPSMHKHRDCSSLICNAPLTNTPVGFPCGCVLPIQVGLRLSVPLYTLFPLVRQLVREIANGVSMRRTQLRIMGAMCTTQQPEKTTVLLDLLPLKAQFDSSTVYLTYYKFWHKLVAINSSVFGDYEVMYIQYPGLPTSPP